MWLMPCIYKSTKTPKTFQKIVIFFEINLQQTEIHIIMGKYDLTTKL